MCLIINSIATQKRKKIFKKHPTRTFYKVFRYYKGRLESPFMDTPVKLSRSGYFYSDREDNNIAQWELSHNSIDQGIHVCLTKKEAEGYVGDENEVMCPVTGHSRDFVACNTYEAVFTKIKLDKNKIKQIIKSKFGKAAKVNLDYY